jgi:hypothetical protein
MPNPGVPQDHRDVDVGFTPSKSEPKVVTAATTLKGWERYVAVTTPSTSTYDLTLPPLSEWVNEEIIIVVDKDLTGEVTVKDYETGTDQIGDNLGAVGDYAICKNVGGLTIAVIKELSS